MAEGKRSDVMVIAKFGGTSVGTAEALKQVRSIVARQRKPTVVVVSALSGVTDALLAAAGHASRQRRAAADAVVADLRARHAGTLRALAGAEAQEAAAAELETIWARLTALLRLCPLSTPC